MESRRIGDSGLISSCLGLGCMGMSAFYGPTDDTVNLRVLAHAVDNGVTMFDTADMYGDGANEKLIGTFLAGRSEKLIVATKVGFRTDADKGKIVDNTPKHIRAACEHSLRRLKRESIDLYYLHRRDPHVPIEDSVGTMQELMTEGKIRAIGLSEVSPATLRAACAESRVAALQIEYSLTERVAEQNVIPVALEHGVTIVAYSPLGRGLLTGRFTTELDFSDTDFRPRVHPRLYGDNLKANAQLIDRFGEIATEIGLPPSSVALAWLLSRGEHVIPIPGTRSQRYLQQNIEATFAHLSTSTMNLLDEIFAPGSIAGERYDEAGLGFLDH